MARSSRASVRASFPASASRGANDALSMEALDRLVGKYGLTPAMLITTTREGSALYGQATGQSRFPLTATAPNRFVFPAAGIEMVFDLDEAGPARQMTFRQGGGTIVLPRRP
jgi:D-alanyl-D-alanine carboxypeptidase